MKRQKQSAAKTKASQKASSFCCEMMRSNAEQRCEMHPDPFDCPDNLIHWGVKGKELRVGLIIHDGGHSFVQISFCPWCGKRLKQLETM